MELMDSLDEIFQWQTPFCCPLLNDVKASEGNISGLDAMLIDIELPEISVGPEQASHPNPLSLSLWPSNPVSIPVCPSHGTRTIPVATSAILAPASIRNPLQLAVNTKPSSAQTGTRGFANPAPTTPMSSAPNTPPVVKLKGSCASGTAKSKGTPKKKSPQELGLAASAGGPKSKKNRVPTTAEHIIRERQRRDDMSAKYLILESLLPPAPKRERAVVVEDAISFVGALQRKKAELLNRRANLKLMAAYNQPPWSKKTGSLAPPRGPLSLGAVVNPRVNPSQCITTKQQTSPENCKSGSPLIGSSDGVVVRADPVLVTSAGSKSAIRVHVEEEKVLMEMVWIQPRPNFQSALLQAVQSLGLDVTQCSFLRVGKDCVQCVVTSSKSQAVSEGISEIQSSSTLIIRALRNMLPQS